jgi:hypothetical protein
VITVRGPLRQSPAWKSVPTEVKPLNTRVTGVATQTSLWDPTPRSVYCLR